MRTLLLLALLPLTACTTVRQGLGEFQRAADKGFEVSIGEPSAPETATPAAAKAAPVPTALVGDTANRRYTTDTPATPK